MAYIGGDLTSRSPPSLACSELSLLGGKSFFGAFALEWKNWSLSFFLYHISSISLLPNVVPTDLEI